YMSSLTIHDALPILRRHVHDDRAQIDADHLLDARDDDDEAGALDLPESSQHEDHAAFVLAQHLDRAEQEHREDRNEEEREFQSKHARSFLSFVISFRDRWWRRSTRSRPRVRAVGRDLEQKPADLRDEHPIALADRRARARPPTYAVDPDRAYDVGIFERDRDAADHLLSAADDGTRSGAHGEPDDAEEEQCRGRRDRRDQADRQTETGDVRVHQDDRAEHERGDAADTERAEARDEEFR